MPVLAVGVAIGSLALGGGAAIGAVVAGTATLAETLTAVASIGAITSAVGSVTGNKGLQTAGLVLGGIGGIGSLAANAGLLGADATTASIFGNPSVEDAAAASSEATGATAAAELPGITNPSTSDIIGSIASPDGTIASPAMAAQTATAPAIAPAAAAQPATTVTGIPANQTTTIGGDTNTLPQGTTGLVNNAPGTPALAGTPGSTLPPSQASVPQGGGIVPQSPGAAAPAAPASGAPAAPANPGAMDGLLAFANKNPMVAYGALSAGGALLSGLTNPTTPAQVAALQAQAAANQATSAQTAAQTANMAKPIPIASGGGNVTATRGLINNTPVSANNVTGSVAA